MVTQSKELTEFYQAYAKWLDAGAPPDAFSFYRDCGLCSNLMCFFRQRRMGEENAVMDEMVSQFREAGLNTSYPFDDSYDAYHIDRYSKTSYLNPLRVQWVREHCNLD